MFTDPRATIKSVDMVEEMQQDAIEVAIRAFTQFAIEREMAAYLKKEFDRKYGLTWHCIVGRNFGSFVTHVKAALFARYGPYRLTTIFTLLIAILLYKSG